MKEYVKVQEKNMNNMELKKIQNNRCFGWVWFLFLKITFSFQKLKQTKKTFDFDNSKDVFGWGKKKWNKE